MQGIGQSGPALISRRGRRSRIAREAQKHATLPILIVGQPPHLSRPFFPASCVREGALCVVSGLLCDDARARPLRWAIGFDYGWGPIVANLGTANEGPASWPGRRFSFASFFPFRIGTVPTLGHSVVGRRARGLAVHSWNSGDEWREAPGQELAAVCQPQCAPGPHFL